MLLHDNGCRHMGNECALVVVVAVVLAEEAVELGAARPGRPAAVDVADPS